MLNKLFGMSNEEKLEYLEGRVLVSLAITIGAIVCSAFSDSALGVIALVGYYWAWELVKRWFGVASFLTIIFGMGNLVVGVIIALAFLMLGYFCGLCMFFIGTVYYVILKLASRK